MTQSGAQEQNTSNNGSTAKVKALPASFYNDFLSSLTKERKPSPIRSLYPLEKTPGLVSLLAGKPNAKTFPFTSVSVNARSPTDANKETTLTIKDDDLTAALQYGDTAGLKGLVDWITGLQEFSHGRKRGEGWRVSIGSGSQDLIFKAVLALLNDGDPVLVEAPVYAGVIPMFSSLHCEQIEVQTDANGILSSSLRSILEQWPAGKPKPKVLYTVPYGCNPTGMTATIERRKEVIKLAREHKFLILEDDPYYYLYYGAAPRPPSYFRLELEEPEVGRVLRFDSLSKILSAGIRIGFASGPETLLNAIDAYTATSNLQTSSLTQMIVFKLLESWGYEDFINHTLQVSEFYKEKRDVFENAMKQHLTGLAEWTPPEAGMFYWFRLLLTAPRGDGASGGDVAGVLGGEEDDSEAVIRTKAVEKGVLALPGTVFLPNGRKSAYVRASFSLADEEDVQKAVMRLREVVLEARGEL